MIMRCSAVGQVEEEAECRQMCRDTALCTTISHLGPASFPLPSHCLLFSSCNTTHNCSDCTTVDRHNSTR